MSNHHNFETLQARLSRPVDTTDRGQTLPKTSEALKIEDAAERLVSLVHALEGERLLAPAIVESGDGCEGEAPTVDTAQGPAVVAFTSVAAMGKWNRSARPVPVASSNQALIAVAQSGARMVIDPDQDGNGIRLPRPAVVALAHGDSWLPAWQDQELTQALADLRSQSIAFVRLQAAASPIQQVMVGITEYGATHRKELNFELHAIATHPRLKPAAEIIELVPVPVFSA